jgi:hypothetical protein
VLSAATFISELAPEASVNGRCGAGCSKACCDAHWEAIVALLSRGHGKLWINHARQLAQHFTRKQLAHRTKQHFGETFSLLWDHAHAPTPAAAATSSSSHKHAKPSSASDDDEPMSASEDRKKSKKHKQ